MALVICRTPFRVSFFGGGTDYPVWYKENGGAVISTTIDKFCYITCRYLPPFFDYKYRIRYFKKEEVKTIDQIKHPSVRECLKHMNISEGVEVVHNADLPAQSGLGSSSTFTVCMLHTLFSLKNEMPTKRELALKAIHIEQDKLHENVGSQDQTSAAFGGFNKIVFGGQQEIKVEQIIMDPAKFEVLEKSVMIFFTGFPREASLIAGEQIKKTSDKQKELSRMMELVEESQAILIGKNRNIEDFGRLLNEQWRIKRSLTSVISTEVIDQIYEEGISAGALGGKLLGAGGGGFILFYVPPERQKLVKEALKNLLYVPIRFEHLGSQVIYFSKL